MSAAPATRTWLRPSYPPVGALTRSGVPRSAAAAARASVVATARHGATAIPARSTNRRSASRSCVTRSGSSPGRTGYPLGGGADHVQRDVLELVGHDVARPRPSRRAALVS